MENKLKLNWTFSLVCMSVLIFWTGPTTCLVNIGKFTSFSHGVKSGYVVILNQKEIQIRDFSYDGQGPAAGFVMGKGQDYLKEKVQLRNFVAIPDEHGSCNVLREYQNRTIILSLTRNTKFEDFDYLSVYCPQFQTNFGYLLIPQNLNLSQVASSTLKECPKLWNSSTTDSPSITKGPSRITGGTVRPAISSPFMTIFLGFFLGLQLFPLDQGCTLGRICSQ